MTDKPSTSIVPAARAPLAPALLAGEVIELEDAFADASLEMDAAGEKFRVAEALQALIALIPSLDTQAGAARFTVSLRTMDVGSASYEEIGVLRFDATPFAGVLTLVAELEVSAAGQTAELELYNLTAGASVTTISTTSVTTAKVTAALTLPLVESLYSVRLRRVGGDAVKHVSCRSVLLEV